MRRRMVLLASSAFVTACFFGGGGNQPAPEAAAPEPAASEAAAPAPAAAEAAATTRAPGATMPWSPADPPPRQQMAAAAAPGAAPARAAAPSARALYSRLGGLAAVRSVVDTMLAKANADARINAFFRGVNMDTLRLNLVEQICEATGGPCTYRGRPMPEAHRGLNISNEHFSALMEDLVSSLEAHRVPERERSELMQAMWRMRGDIVGK